MIKIKYSQGSRRLTGSRRQQSGILLASAAAALFLSGGGVGAQAMTETRCARIGKAVVGLNYERSSPEFPDRKQIWRFEADGVLSAYAASDFGKATAPKPGGALWKFVFEDQFCALKVASKTKSHHWSTYRLQDVTWAIVTANAAERHIPDFKDHTGMRMRFCGKGEQCKASPK